MVKEVAEGALIGPLTNPPPPPPFTPWCVFSPIMTRPKDQGRKRRIIVDLSFPDGGVNQHIPKNVVDGHPVTHTLPTIQDALGTIHSCDSAATHMAAIDVSRAYRNFRVCPADWPLMAIHHQGHSYLDMGLPFGARSSSYSMQQVAVFVVHALAEKGVKSLMYLDDLLIVAPSYQHAHSHYTSALGLMEGLGLPIAREKLQPPARQLVWLGIQIDLDTNTISIPEEKLKEITKIIALAAQKKRPSIKETQSLTGSINHLSKAVAPARLFMGRLLEALWQAG